MKDNIAKILFVALFSASFFLPTVISLLAGILLAVTLGSPFKKFTKKISKYLLQLSVIGLGFGMNLHSAIEAGKDGMLFTIVSVIGVMCLGVLLGKAFRLSRNNSYLISSGTAICGGSAIAAIAPIIDAGDDETTLSMATVFTLNAAALLIFPAIGHLLGMSQEQFGTWAAIAIHDTSSVVGAGAAYGEEALKVATTVKLTRALWIIPMAVATTFIFRKKGKKISIPWFILIFIIAMLANTYFGIPEAISAGIVTCSKHALGATLFLIGCGISVQSIRNTGIRPFALGISLWIIISAATLAVTMLI
ncbi:MAG: putative sulfate exporter family transporter [Bacteroidetes bacterium]|uniref:Sulfate exporter family transporter n=1 Tax=Candidatus Merdivivens pullicola TaxID=2840872 RepID=A0A9D9IJV5_9BACT|nr:putative sulfate exporter family transporter [Candidatus Merdivivens pullicola]